MEKKYLFLILVLVLVGSVFAGLEVGSFNKQKFSDVVSANVSIIINCGLDDCLWSAFEEGKISTYDNGLKRYWTNRTYNLTSGELISFEDIYFTDDEIKDLVADLVLEKLEKYELVKSLRQNYTLFSSGNLEVVKK